MAQGADAEATDQKHEKRSALKYWAQEVSVCSFRQHRHTSRKKHASLVFEPVAPILSRRTTVLVKRIHTRHHCRPCIRSLPILTIERPNTWSPVPLNCRRIDALSPPPPPCHHPLRAIDSLAYDHSIMATVASREHEQQNREILQGAAWAAPIVMSIPFRCGAFHNVRIEVLLQNESPAPVRRPLSPKTNGPPPHSEGVREMFGARSAPTPPSPSSPGSAADRRRSRARRRCGTPRAAAAPR